jgi:poly(A) polymerase
MSADEIRRIVWLVAQHMRVSVLPEMREGRRRLFVAEPDFPLLLDLSEMDCAASHGDMTRVVWIRDYLAGLTGGVSPPACPVTGDDLIRLGLHPGPLFREILTELREGFLEGRYASREEALAWVAERHGGDIPR